MLKLETLTEETLAKLYQLLNIIRQAIAFSGKEKEYLLIPKAHFEKWGFLVYEVETLINRINSEESDLLKLIIHRAPTLPTTLTSNHLMWAGVYESPEDYYKDEKRQYEEVYSKSIHIKVSDHGKLLQFEKKVATEIEDRKYLVCKKLRFNPDTGETIYFKVKTKFTPGTQEFLLLRELLRKNGEWLSYESIIKVISKDKQKQLVKADSTRIRSLVRNIKNKLGMTDAGAKALNINKSLPSLFKRASNGLAMEFD